MKIKLSSHSIHSCMPSPPLSCRNKTSSFNVSFRDSSFDIEKSNASSIKKAYNKQMKQQQQQYFNFTNEKKAKSVDKRDSLFQGDQQNNIFYKTLQTSQNQREEIFKNLSLKKEQNKNGQNKNIELKNDKSFIFNSQQAKREQNLLKQSKQTEHNQISLQKLLLIEHKEVSENKSNLFKNYRQSNKHKNQINRFYFWQESQQMKEELLKLKQRILQLQQEKEYYKLATDKDRQISELKQQIRGFQQKNSHFIHQNGELLKQIQKLKLKNSIDLHQHQNKIKIFQNSIVKLETQKEMIQQKHVNQKFGMLKDYQSLENSKNSLQDMIKTKDMLIKIHQDNSTLLKKQIENLTSKHTTAQSIILDLQKRNQFLNYDLNNFRAFHEHQIFLANEDGHNLREIIFQLRKNLQQINKQRQEFASFKCANQFSVDFDENQSFSESLPKQRELRTKNSLNTNFSLNLDFNTVLLKVQSQVQKKQKESKDLFQKKQFQPRFVYQNVFTQTFYFDNNEKVKQVQQMRLKEREIWNQRQQNLLQLIKNKDDRVCLLSSQKEENIIKIQTLNEEIQNLVSFIQRLKKEEDQKINEKNLFISQLQFKLFQINDKLSFQIKRLHKNYQIALILLQDLKKREMSLQHELYVKNRINGQHMKYIQQLEEFRKNIELSYNLKQLQRKDTNTINIMQSSSKSKQFFTLTQQSEQYNQQIEKSNKGEFSPLCKNSQSQQAFNLIYWNEVHAIKENLSQDDQN